MKLIVVNTGDIVVDALKGGIAQHIAPISQGAINVSAAQPDGVYVIHLGADEDAPTLCQWLQRHAVGYQVHDGSLENLPEKMAELLPFFARQFGVDSFPPGTPERQQALLALGGAVFPA